MTASESRYCHGGKPKSLMARCTSEAHYLRVVLDSAPSCSLFFVSATNDSTSAEMQLGARCVSWAPTFATPGCGAGCPDRRCCEPTIAIRTPSRARNSRHQTSDSGTAAKDDGHQMRVPRGTESCSPVSLVFFRPLPHLCDRVQVDGGMAGHAGPPLLRRTGCRRRSETSGHSSPAPSVGALTYCNSSTLICPTASSNAAIDQASARSCAANALARASARVNMVNQNS